MSAYDLLAKETLELTDAEVEAIVKELQTKRDLYVKKKVEDRPDRDPVKAATAEEKKANAKNILAQLNLTGL